jgi:hypothetical protein
VLHRLSPPLAALCAQYDVAANGMAVIGVAALLAVAVYSAAYLVSWVVDHDIYAAAASKRTCIKVAATAEVVTVRITHWYEAMRALSKSHIYQLNNQHRTTLHKTSCLTMLVLCCVEYAMLF